LVGVFTLDVQPRDRGHARSPTLAHPARKTLYVARS
jgi:hypothetical protein